MSIEIASHHRAEWSAERSSIVAALFCFQADVKALPRTNTATIRTEKGDYTYRYADLQDTWDAVRVLLQKNGLYVHQTMEVSAVSPSDRVMLVTEIHHVPTGEWCVGYMPVQTYAKPQQTGASITYMRRYHLQTMLGLSTEDPDADLEGKAIQALADTRNEYVPKIDKLLGQKRSEQIEDDMLALIDTLAPWQHDVVWKDLNSHQKGKVRDLLAAARNRKFGIEPPPASEKDERRERARENK